MLPEADQAPELDDVLSQVIEDPNYRDIINYVLEMAAHLNTCAGSLPDGKIYYKLHWHVHEDGWAHAEDFHFDDHLSDEGGPYTPAMHKLFEGCVLDYFLTHDTHLRYFDSEEKSWGMTATFPTRDALIYQIITDHT